MHTFVTRGGPWVVGQGILFVGIVIVAWATPRLDLPWWLAATTGTVGLCGLVLAVWAATTLGSSITPYPQPVSGGDLVVRGPYRWSRHPIYGGVALGATFISLAVGEVWATLVAVQLFPYFWAKSRFEESKLEGVFPGYGGYRRRVPKRLIPFVW